MTAMNEPRTGHTPDVVDEQGAAADLKPRAAAEPIDWDLRLRSAVEQTIAKRQARRVERAALKVRRDAGLRARHGTNLARGEARPAPESGEAP